jgi:hypothetical protein
MDDRGQNPKVRKRETEDNQARRNLGGVKGSPPETGPDDPKGSGTDFVK